jgi:ribosomal RNA assembly protein
VVENIFRLKIPSDRVGVLIGPQGNVKRRIEELGGVTVKVDSKMGSVEVKLKDETQDPSALLKVRNVVTAIGRGFSPEKAFRLFDDDALLDIIDLKVYGKSESGIKRIKGRLIGERGKAWRIIEECSGALLSIYGHTVAIIGDFESHRMARQAVMMLLEGRQHSTVYRYLTREKRRRVETQVDLWYSREASR